MKQIQTSRLTLRPVEETDWKTVQAIWRDFEKSEYRIYDSPKSTEDKDVQKRIARWADATKSGREHIFFAVCRKDTMIGFYSLNIRPGGYELSYGFLQEFQGNGYAGESLKAILDFAREIGAEKLFAGTAIPNVKSVRLLLRNGFRQTGTETLSFFKDERGNDLLFEGGLFEIKL